MQKSLAILALLAVAALASRDASPETSFMTENADLLKSLNVGASIAPHILAQDSDDDRSFTEQNLEDRFRDFNVAYIRMWLRNEVEHIWDVKLQNASHIHKVDEVLIECIKDDPARWGKISKDCENQFGVYLQLIGHAYVKTKDTFEEAWSEAFNETYDEVIGGHEDEAIEEAVNRIVEDVYKTTLTELDVDWKEASVRITRAIYKYRGQKPGEAVVGDYVDEERFKNAVAATGILADESGQGVMNAPQSFLQISDPPKDNKDEKEDKARVLETLPDGKTPRDIAQVYLNLLKEKMENEDFKEDWVAAFDRHFNDNIEDDNDFKESFERECKMAFDDEDFKPECLQFRNKMKIQEMFHLHARWT
eukprot:TRINITY_DN603_c0_g1_i1.p2 TRINITY_DN603_c0_g1~~TRINITY_DN603_c0_g1_i1.p2  ORF type:complete len:364 (+),score=148.18 TRINITY_DN603_c0_g1_i1:281-1372(+)